MSATRMKNTSGSARGRVAPALRAAGALLLLSVSGVLAASFATNRHQPAGHYATVSGYRMYYEEYGHGRPLVLLHGGLNTIAGSFAQQITLFARHHRVIAIEQVGHGHTADALDTFTYERMAADTEVLLRELHVGRADFVGWSDGGIIALVIARRDPAAVRRLVVSGVNVDLDGERPEDVQALRDDPDPDPVAYKVRQLWLTPVVLERSDLERIEAPVLLVSGDHDAIRLEHTLEIFQALPRAQLCILPGTGHDTFQSAASELNPMILRFLDAS
jgi:pimeloyl-ACP methyl ester carboxylesterase